MNQLRKASVAGIFYPADPQALKNHIRKFLSLAKVESKLPVKFLIVPHAGYSYSGKIAGEAYAEIETGAYKHVIAMGPSHRFYFKGIAESDESLWESPLGTVNIKLLNRKNITSKSEYHRGEHCLEVQIPFLKYLLPKTEISPLLLSGPHTQAKNLAETLIALDSEHTLWVISSDFSHTGPSFQHFPREFGFDSGETMDLKAIEYITSGDIKGFLDFLARTESSICGALPILVALHLLKKMGRPDFRFKKYDSSGRQTGDQSSVGYAALFS